MSKVLDAVIPAAARAAPPEQAPVVNAPETVPFAEQQKSWSREEMADWRMTGNEPKRPASAAAPAEKSAEKTDEPSAPKGETQAATDTADDDQELPEGDTVEARRARNRMFAKMRHDNATLKAKFELLEQQRKETPARTTESAPAPKVDAKAGPQPPDPNDPKYKGEDGWLQFVDDRADYRAELKYQANREADRAKETTEQREAKVEGEFKERQSTLLKQREGEETEVHRTRTLEYANASRFVVAEIGKANAHDVEQAMLISEQGPRLILHFAANREEFADILAMPPHRALLALGKLEARFEQKTPELKPVTRTKAPDPGDRVDSSASANGDPLKAAYAKYDQTKDPKDLQHAMKLENEKDLARLTRK